MRELSLAVVGADFPNRRGPTRRFEIAMCRPGDRVFLAPEPKNPADSRAVQVVSGRNVVIGYISAERCGWIGGMIAHGRELRAIFQAATDFGAIVRVAFDGLDPELPTPAIGGGQPPAEQVWWPDDIPQDD